MESDPGARPPVLVQRLSSAPWVVCSLLVHLFVAVLFFSVTWREGRDDKRAAIIAAWAAPATSDVVSPAEPAPDPTPDPDALEHLEEVELVEEEVFTELVEDEWEELEGDGTMAVTGPFSDVSPFALTGVAGPATGKFGARRRGAASYAGSAGMSRALTDGLDWLARHQSEDGRWDCDGYMRNGAHGNCECEGGGSSNYDVGVTSLALLAFLGAGNSTASGPYRENVARGIRWLREQQDPDTGLIASTQRGSYIYGHALATMALCEAYHATKSPLLKKSCVDAVHLIQRARNPYSAWRYRYPPNGQNDTSVTWWMIFALAIAADAGLEVDPGALDGGMEWIDHATNPDNGRVGYSGMGGGRPSGSRGEAMTAVGLLSRIFLQDLGRPSDPDVLEQHVEVLLRDLPSWSRTGGKGVDMYYWYYGTYAMYQMGGAPWDRWERALETAVVSSQEKRGHEKGSWDPIGAWCGSGGRVYSTALLTMCLEVYFRYDRLLGAR